MEEDAIQTELNGLKNLLGQIGDPAAKRAAGIIGDDEFAELRARQLAYTAAVDGLSKGEEVSVDSLLERMRDAVAQPTQEEINAANIDYLLMIGGDE